MTLAITTYQVYLSVHILCAVVWVGGGTALVLQVLRAKRERSPERLAQIAGDAEWIGSRVFAPVSLVLVIFGFLLVNKGDWQWHFWLVWGMVFWALSFVTGAGFLGPQAGRIKKLMDERGPTDPEVQQRINRVLLVARIDNIALILVVLDMALKPGL
jgi:uncharacterized membrane protein